MAPQFDSDDTLSGQVGNRLSRTVGGPIVAYMHPDVDAILRRHTLQKRDKIFTRVERAEEDLDDGFRDYPSPRT